MDLTWWPVLPAGLAGLILCVALALALGDRTSRGLRPLAHVDRLTALPEYARIRRHETIWAAIVVALLALLFGVAVLGAARPAGSARDVDARYPEDVMLCVADPVTADGTGEFLNYFARQAAGYGTQRIGLTSPTVRLLPLTRDYQHAAQVLGDYGRLAAWQDDTEAGRPVPQAEAAAMRSRADAFNRVVPYTDYSPTVADTLALCMTGFPAAEAGGGHRRSLIYLGPGNLGDGERSLFTGEQVGEMAKKAGIQVNAVVGAGPGAGGRRGEAALSSLTEHTGGRFFRRHGDGPALPAALDTIRANPAPVVTGDGTPVPDALPDDPGPLLITALAGSVLLCAALAVRRR